MQCDSFIDFNLVVQPAAWHIPYAPCFVRRLRAFASVLQPSSLHTFLLLPPCLEHLPVDTAPEVHPSAVQNPFAPCFTHSPFPRALLLQLSAEHFSFLEWCAQIPLFCAFQQHAYTLQIPMTPCFMQTNLPRIWLVVQLGAAHSSFGSCFVHCLPRFTAGVVQLHFVERTRRLLRACCTGPWPSHRWGSLQ